MSEYREKSIAYANAHHAEFINNLIAILKIPSISTSDVSKPDILSAANWLASHMLQLGIDNVQVFPTDGHPVVYGDWLHAGSSKPTVLIYGHYDVQPADPLDLWTTAPFEPSIRGDALFARGSSDMKGQVMASLNAVESILKQGPLPLNVKFILEGEEEIGSPSLAGFIRDHKQLLSCDVALNPDTGMIAPQVPTIVYGLRGLAYFELHVSGPDHDLHSGMFGGVVHNPAQALCELIAGMKDAQGRITLPGFYDSVRPLSEEERKNLQDIPTGTDYYISQTGAPALKGEEGFTPTELVGARPTLDVNGIISGFTGQGSKTIIPSTAMAKISMRLVPDQDPHQVYEQLRQYLVENAPASIRWNLVSMSGGPACLTDIHHPATQALHRALELVWGTSPKYKREGGSVPVVADMQQILGVESVLTGFGLPEDNIHSPNEHLNIPNWYKGIDALIHFFFNYAEGSTL